MKRKLGELSDQVTRVAGCFLEQEVGAIMENSIASASLGGTDTIKADSDVEIQLVHDSDSQVATQVVQCSGSL